MTDFEVRQIRQDELQAWDNLVNASSDGTLFHSRSWKEVLDAGYGSSRGQIMHLGCFDDGRLIGGYAGYSRRRGPVALLQMPLLTPYMGCMIEPVTRQKAAGGASRFASIATAINTELKRLFHYVDISHPIAIQDMRPHIHDGFAVTPRYTYLLDLQPGPDILWNNFDGHVRRQIRKAERLGLTLGRTVRPDEAFDLLTTTFTRRGETCSVPLGLFSEVVTSQQLQGNREIFSVLRDGALISYAVILKHKASLYYAIASTAPDQLSTGVSSLLLWEIIRTYAGSDLVFDLVGANLPAIAKFKEGFNPRLQPFFQTRYSHRALSLAMEFRKKR